MRTTLKYSAAILALGAATLSWASADKPFDKQVAAEERGVVEVSNTAGALEISGWDQHQVSVHGELGDGVERVDVISEPGHTLIKVVLPSSGGSRDGEAHLHIRIPRDSELHVSTVSADTTISGVNGVQRLNAVSGDVTTEIAGANLELKTVSGDIKVKGHGQPAQLRVTSVSGDVRLEHGGGDLETSTVSGSLVVSLDTARSVHARTTSGDMHFDTKMTRGSSFEASTVSGDLTVRASAEGGYAYEVSTFSGDISDCFGGQKAEKGIVGHSLSGSRGEGAGHMRLKTMSGDVELCDRI
jgi:DUF4097 and DUF4098 domain-containing protein YvlB